MIINKSVKPFFSIQCNIINYFYFSSVIVLRRSMAMNHWTWRCWGDSSISNICAICCLSYIWTRYNVVVWTLVDVVDEWAKLTGTRSEGIVIVQRLFITRTVNTARKFKSAKIPITASGTRIRGRVMPRVRCFFTINLFFSWCWESSYSCGTKFPVRNNRY